MPRVISTIILKTTIAWNLWCCEYSLHGDSIVNISSPLFLGEDVKNGFCTLSCVSHIVSVMIFLKYNPFSKNLQLFTRITSITIFQVESILMNIVYEAYRYLAPACTLSLLLPLSTSLPLLLSSHVQPLAVPEIPWLTAFWFLYTSFFLLLK